MKRGVVKIGSQSTGHCDEFCLTQPLDTTLLVKRAAKSRHGSEYIALNRPMPIGGGRWLTPARPRKTLHWPPTSEHLPPNTVDTSPLTSRRPALREFAEARPRQIVAVVLADLGSNDLPALVRGALQG